MGSEMCIRDRSAVHMLTRKTRLMHCAPRCRHDVRRMLTVSDEFRAGSSDPTLPLSDGALDENLGVPIAIVLTKADQVDDKRALSPTQVDYVQQVVRTIALRYGAAVFSVSQSAPVHSVRDYIKTRLFSRPASTTASAVDAATLAVPSGWDSWSQIRVANESFDCRRTICLLYTSPSPRDS